MNRTLLLAVVALGVVAAPGMTPEARADRLGGNFRGPDDKLVLREEPPSPPPAPARRHPLLDEFGLDRPFLCGTESATKEAAFRGRPLLVFFAFRGCETSRAVAEQVFGNDRVIELVARFVPSVADAEKEEVFGVAHGVRTFPTILVLDASGREVDRVEGTADASRVAATLRRALAKAGAPRPTAGARALEDATERLDRARKAGDWKSRIAAAATIEEVGHEGPEMEQARAARVEAEREAASRLDEARRLAREGDRTDARRLLDRTVREFSGLRQSEEATVLLDELQASGSGGRGLGRHLRPFGDRGTPTLDPGAVDPSATTVTGSDPVSIPSPPPSTPEVPDGTIDGPPPPPPIPDPPVDDP